MPDQMLWIGGAQWAGKTSVARLLARRHCLQLYECDYHDSRGHSWRAMVDPQRYPNVHTATSLSPDQRWVFTTPEEMAGRANRIFDERFEMVLEDLAPLPVELAFLVEGWCIRPHHLAPLLAERRRAVFLVPDEDFRQHQLETLDRARSAVHLGTSDAESAQRNRVDRDRILAAEVSADARRCGFPVLSIDGSQSLDEVAAVVEYHFGLEP